MKLSYSSLLAFIFLGAAVAAPNKLEQREPSNEPIHLDHQFPDTESKECGGKKFTQKQVYLSVQYAVNLIQKGETTGFRKYPQPFPYNDSKGTKLIFPDYCPADKNRREYPLKAQPYHGGPKNTDPGMERVIFYWKKGDESADAHPKVIYCGLVTHTGAKIANGFLNC